MSAKQIKFMPVYEAADLWIERALKCDDSLFTPGKPIWSERWLEEARERFLDRTEEWKGAGFFEHRLPAVLADSPPEVCQLIGEAMYVTYLIVHKCVVGQAKKMENINRVLPERVEIPHYFQDALESGIMDPGAFFRNNFGIHLAFVIEFADKWKAEGLGDKFLDRGDSKGPYEFKKVVMDTTIHKLVKGYTCNSPNAMWVGLLHLAHPDSFEAMAIKFKEKLANTPRFCRFVTKPTDDPDCKIKQIRKRLEHKYGENFTFFDDEVEHLWNK